MNTQISNNTDQVILDASATLEAAETTLRPNAGAEVLRRVEAAELLRVSAATFDRLQLPRHLVGSSPRYLRSELLEWLRGRGS